MDKKLLSKIAARYASTLERIRDDTIKDIGLAIESKGEFIVQKIRNLSCISNKLYELNGSKKTGDFKAAILRTRYRDIQDRLRSVEGLLDNLTNLSNTPSQREIMEELEIVSNRWKVEYSDDVFYALIEDVELEEIYLGSFWIGVNLCDEFQIIPVSVDNILSDGGLVHPNIKDEHICLGDGEDLCHGAIRQGRLEDFFDNIESLLNTYGGSPHEELDGWRELTECADCGSGNTEDDMFSCKNCDNSLCPDCFFNNQCNSCMESFCDNCSRFCVACNDKICTECTESCGSCSGMACPDCMVECDGCSDIICPECSNHNHKNGNNYCSQCMDICGLCETVVHKDDIYVCGCGNEICSDCSKICSRCQEHVCKHCIIYCDHCGVYMCNKCDTIAECLLEGK